MTQQMIAVTHLAMEVTTVVHPPTNVVLARGIVMQILTVSLAWLVARITVEDLALILQMIAATVMEENILNKIAKFKAIEWHYTI